MIKFENISAILLGMVMLFGALAEVAGAESRIAGESPAARQKQETPQVIWAGESGGFNIRWTDGDIQIHPSKSPNRVVFSARSLAQQEFARIKASENKYGLKERYCEIVASYGIFSVVGSSLSLFEGGDVDCEETAHPSHTSRFIAIDLKKPGGFTKKRVKLTDYFPEAAIYQALLADPRVRRDLARRGLMRKSTRSHCLFIVPAILLFSLNRPFAGKIPVRLNRWTS